jgi:uncharacterized RDD family membrane protein YckC
MESSCGTHSLLSEHFMIVDEEAAPIDARIEVVTPENIAVHYRVAGPLRRVLALLIDLAILCCVCVSVSMLAGFAGLFSSPGFATGALLVTYFLLYWFAFGAQEAYFNGRTLGKYILGLRVITVDGQPINGLQAIMRSFLRLPSFMLPLVDLITMTLNDKFQRLGDIVCGTVVVVEERNWLFGVAKLEDPRAVQLSAYIPANFEITKSLAKALSTYVERRKFFTPPRRREVARHIAEPLLHRFELPNDTSYDLLLCALYYRAFIADRGAEDEHVAALVAAAAPSFANPFNNSAMNTSTTGNGINRTDVIFPSSTRGG